MAASVRPSRQAVTVTASPGVTVPPLITDAYQRAQPGHSTWSMRFQYRSVKQSPILWHGAAGALVRSTTSPT